jgi:hypothetical protein
MSSSSPVLRNVLEQSQQSPREDRVTRTLTRVVGDLTFLLDVGEQEQC